MDDDCLKLTAYFGERDRIGERFLAEALAEIYARHRLHASLVMRAVEGFGAAQHLRTDRLLTLSEDLPLVAVAVDSRARIEPALADVAKLQFGGLVTLERAWLLRSRVSEPPRLPASADVKLTVYVGRGERVGGLPAHRAIVALLHERGIAGATVLLGVDGTAHGERRRARFFAGNRAVPLMVIAVGEGERIAAVVPELAAMLARPLLSFERVQVHRGDGVGLGELPQPPPVDPNGLEMWVKLMIYTSEHASVAGRPLHEALVRGLRRTGAAGATSLRGIWGFHGEHEPHGDSFWQLRRHVPIVTVAIDTPDRIAAAYAVAEELTRGTGLVTSEPVPVLRVSAGGG